MTSAESCGRRLVQRCATEAHGQAHFGVHSGSVSGHFRKFSCSTSGRVVSSDLAVGLAGLSRSSGAGSEINANRPGLCPGMPNHTDPTTVLAPFTSFYPDPCAGHSGQQLHSTKHCVPVAGLGVLSSKLREGGKHVQLAGPTELAPAGKFSCSSHSTRP